MVFGTILIEVVMLVAALLILAIAGLFVSRVMLRS
jgi:hypothetical protein